MFLIGCQKETELKTESNVKIHEIEVAGVGESTIVYWYIFFKNEKFIYTKSPIPMNDFSSTFFMSSKQIPKELKFSEDLIRGNGTDTVDMWGVEVVELQEDSTTTDSTIVSDSVVVNSMGVDSLFLDTFDYEIGEKQ
jgi:hypothetical protein